MKAFSILSMLPVAVVTTQAEAFAQPYNYRTSAAYHKLAESDREKLDAVSCDMTLLWGALDRYADDHDERAPESLDDLVPQYLKKLPKDPFATTETASEKSGYYQPSLEGYGYGYRQGQGRSWITSSVGLPNFPYLVERGNIGLSLPKGTWLSGRQPAFLE